jgi:hypothetical protein
VEQVAKPSNTSCKFKRTGSHPVGFGNHEGGLSQEPHFSSRGSQARGTRLGFQNKHDWLRIDVVLIIACSQAMLISAFVTKIKYQIRSSETNRRMFFLIRYTICMGTKSVWEQLEWEILEIFRKFPDIQFHE